MYQNDQISIGKLLSEVHIDARTILEAHEMVEMISEYVDDASLISFQFSTKWKSIVMDQKGIKLVMK